MINTIAKSIRTSGIKTTANLIKSSILKRLNFKISYSQYNEDLIIDKLLGHKKDGFYIDIGAYDPAKLNNTKIFSDRGWKGINIDPNPETIKKFNEERARDINLNVGLASANTTLRAVLFENCRSYTLSSELIKQREKESLKILDDIEVPVTTLSQIFDEHVKNNEVDFISVDTEGLDLEVLKGNDWSKFRPKVVCVETYNEEGDNKNYRSLIHDFMKSAGYRLSKDTGLNSIFIDSEASFFQK